MFYFFSKNKLQKASGQVIKKFVFCFWEVVKFNFKNCFKNNFKT